MKLGFVRGLCCLILCLSLGGCAAKLSISFVDGEGRPFATVFLREEGRATSFACHIEGGKAETRYALILRSLVDGQASASFQVLGWTMTNGQGDGRISGYVTYRGIEPLPLRDLADGEHALVLSDGDTELPRLIERRR